MGRVRDKWLIIFFMAERCNFSSLSTRSSETESRARDADGTPLLPSAPLSRRLPPSGPAPPAPAESLLRANVETNHWVGMGRWTFLRNGLTLASTRTEHTADSLSCVGEAHPERPEAEVWSLELCARSEVDRWTKARLRCAVRVPSPGCCFARPRLVQEPCCGGPEHPALLSSVPGKLSRGCPRTAGVPPAMRETPGNQACSHVRGGEALLKPETGGVRVCSPSLTGRALGWLSRSSGPRAVCGAAGMRGPPAPARSCLSRGAGSHGCRCSGSLSRAHACHSCYLGKSPCESRCLEGSEITGVGGLLADWTDRGRGSVRMRGAGPWVPDSSGSRGLHAAL